jgi:hypothetical protein
MRLEVVPGELGGLADGLSGLLGDLELAGDIRSISSGAAENAELRAAIERLVLRWTGDLHDLQMKLGALTRQLDGAGVEYDRVERLVTQDVAVVPQGGEILSRDIEF